MLKEIKEYARSIFIPIILDDSLSIVKMILAMKKPKRILEIGTAVGYSASCFSSFLADNGKIDTIELDHKMVLIARANLDMLELTEKINIIEADAGEALSKLTDKYDIIFIDGPKSHYIEYLPICLKLLNKGGVIVADNISYKGMVTGSYTGHKQRTAVNKLREFIEVVRNDNKLKDCLLEVGDGIMIISKVEGGDNIEKA